MSEVVRPSDNPFNAQHLDALRYVEFDYALAEVADRLKRYRYRGAIVGPHGCGKTAMLQALGDQLMEHGLTPLPLFVNLPHATLSRQWRNTIRRARHTDVLLLDGYDLLPYWARAWVQLASYKAGGVIVTAHKPVRWATIARPSPSPALLRRLIDQLAPSANGTIDATQLHREANGNLRDAMRLAYDVYAQTHGPKP